MSNDTDKNHNRTPRTRRISDARGVALATKPAGRERRPGEVAWWENLKRARENRGFSGEELAILVNISKSTYFRLESGVAAYIEIDVLLNICKVLKITPNDIFLEQK